MAHHISGIFPEQVGQDLLLLAFNLPEPGSFCSNRASGMHVNPAKRGDKNAEIKT